MKKFFALISMLLLITAGSALAQEENVPILACGISGEYFEDMLEYNGKIMLPTEYHDYPAGNYCAIQVLDIKPSEIWRLNISGTAEDGNRFYYTETLDSSNISDDYAVVEFPVSIKSGKYGPYRLELVGETHSQNYRISFFVQENMPLEEGMYMEDMEYGIVDKGIVMQSEFAMTSLDLNSIQFIYPSHGAILSGGAGYAIECRMEMPGLTYEEEYEEEHTLFLELAECASGKVIASESMSLQENISEFSDDLGRFGWKTPALGAPVFGTEYELRARLDDGKRTGSVRFTLADESMLDAADFENTGVQLIQFLPEETLEINLDNSDPGQPIICNFHTGKDIVIAVSGISGNHRIRLSDKSKNGNIILYEKAICAAQKNFTPYHYLNISKRSGEYGPFVLEVICGSKVYSYELIFKFAKNAKSEEWDWRPYVADEKQHVTPFFLQYAPMMSLIKPVNGSTLSAPQGSALDAIIAIKNEMFPEDLLLETMCFQLRNTSTGRITELKSPKFRGAVSTGDWFFMELNNIALTENFQDGAQYDLIVYDHLSGTELASTRITLIEERVRSERERALTSDYTVCGPQAIAAIENVKKQLGEIPFHIDAIGYYADAESAGNSILNCFSRYAPMAYGERIDEEIAYLPDTANQMIYDAYDLHKRGLNQGSSLLNPEKLEELFGKNWLDVQGFEHARGYAESGDGSYYYWIPVYYPDTNGEICEGTLSLFVYILHEGIDEEYFEQHSTFVLPYGEYRTEKMFITDPAVVVEILSIMRSCGSKLEQQDTTPAYEALYRESSGDAVRRIQDALVEKGFLTSSVDGYYSTTTEAAVSAYQQAMGLEPTGEADAQTQQMLLSREDDKARLLGWLDGH